MTNLTDLERWLNFRKSFTLNPISKKKVGITLLITFGAQGSDLASFLKIGVKVEIFLRLSNI